MNQKPTPQLLESHIRDATAIFVFTGAGISTNSGIPDYRGPQGVWKQRQPVYYQDFMTSEDARREYWDEKQQAWEQFRDAEPNAVHHAAVQLESAGKLRAVVTQNIDGLHAKAGTSAERLVELHGTNLAVACQSCGERSSPEPHFQSFRRDGSAPLCRCGGYLKPATISFGQNLDEVDLRQAVEIAESADLVIALGTTLSVHPAASLTLLAARRGIPYFIVNRGHTDHDSLPEVTGRYEGDVSDIFPAAVTSALNR